MRIIAGTHGGRILSAPRGQTTRPTTDRDREALFSALSHQLGHDFEGLRVLDLFAGSGTLGLEALSRGARHCTFIDKDPKAIATIKANIEALNEGSNTAVIHGNALRPAHSTQGYDLAFADAPYGKGHSLEALLAAQANGALTPSALCLMECGTTEQSALDGAPIDIRWQRTRADSHFALFQPKYS